MKVLDYFGVVLLPTTVVISACQNSNAISQPPSTEESKQTARMASKDQEHFSDLFVKGNSITYADYDIIKSKKTVRDENTAYRATEITYLVVERNGRTVGQFDSVYFPIGNATDFGLFSFLGDETKQLAISQTVPRGGNHWIVQLYPEYRMLFDSAEYEVGREHVKIMDMEKDGIYEISLPVTSFYGGFKVPEAGTPLPVVIFKYEEKERRYLPANHIFRDYLLNGVDHRIKEMRTIGSVSEIDVLDIMLGFLYAGRESEGWSFFDEEYKLPDKEKVRSKLEGVLKKAPAYRYIRDHRAN